ncbi:DUF362 domain-containing protein [bacterium]|nr:DUF362 domain-containing protein [bacterium]
MKKSKVLFTPRRELKRNDNYMNKIEKIWNALGCDDIYKKRDIVAVKVHFGERGNSTFIKPHYVAHIIKLLKANGCKPFLTDTATLYAGGRTNAVDHIETAMKHGFSYATMGCPIVIADGLYGRNSETVKIDKKNFSEVSIASGIFEAEKLLVISHFKFHEVTGFGGAIKNLSMGCCSRKGKLEMHSDFKPRIESKKCVACGYCIKNCPVKALSFGSVSSGRKIAQLDSEKCIGCGECLGNCRYLAIGFDWNLPYENIMEKIAEYALGTTLTKEKITYFNFLESITPLCDCYGFSDAHIVPDLGIMGSIDPVSLDKACCDIVNDAPTNLNSRLKEESDDKFTTLFPDVNWRHKIEYSENIGLGSAEYELKTI